MQQTHQVNCHYLAHHAGLGLLHDFGCLLRTIQFLLALWSFWATSINLRKRNISFAAINLVNFTIIMKIIKFNSFLVSACIGNAFGDIDKTIWFREVRIGIVLTVVSFLASIAFMNNVRNLYPSIEICALFHEPRFCVKVAIVRAGIHFIFRFSAK